MTTRKKKGRKVKGEKAGLNSGLPTTFKKRKISAFSGFSLSSLSIQKPFPTRNHPRQLSALSKTSRWVHSLPLHTSTSFGAPYLKTLLSQPSWYPLVEAFFPVKTPSLPFPTTSISSSLSLLVCPSRRSTVLQVYLQASHSARQFSKNYRTLPMLLISIITIFL